MATIDIFRTLEQKLISANLEDKDIILIMERIYDDQDAKEWVEWMDRHPDASSEEICEHSDELWRENPVRKEFVGLVNSIDAEIGLEEENAVLLLHLMNTEDKIFCFNDWIKTKLIGDTLSASETEICRAAVQISKGEIPESPERPVLSDAEKDIIAIMKDLGAEVDAIFVVLSTLGEEEDEDEKKENTEKLLKYIFAKGKYCTVGDILSKVVQICLPAGQYLPFNMFVRFLGETSEELVQGKIYDVSISYDNDREFLLENELEENEIYDAKLFEILEVGEFEYIGNEFEGEDDEPAITEGFTIGEVYSVVRMKNGNYICENGLECGAWEGKPTKYRPAPPKEILPFRQPDGALKLMRQALEFGSLSMLEDRLSSSCEFIDQDASFIGPNAMMEFHEAEEIIDYLKTMTGCHLICDIFYDCALATVTKSAEGNRFAPGERCMPYFVNGKAQAVVFVKESDGVINGIYILTEPYEFELDEP